MWWGIACVAVSLVPLFLEIIYLCLTKQQFILIISRPSIPAIAVILCAMTIIDIATLKEYKRDPFRLPYWILGLFILGVLDMGCYVVFLTSNVPHLFNLITFAPVAGTVVASFYAQRHMAKLETDAEGENE